MIKLYKINSEYLDYLRKTESKIPLDDYPGRYKPFIGILFKNDDCLFVVGLSSVKPKHLNLSNKKDFIKVKVDKVTVAIINLNYMFPVPITEIKEVPITRIGELRSFDSIQEKSQYINFLKLELKEIDKLSVESKAYSLYTIKEHYPDCILSKRCLNFRELECKCTEWIIKNNYGIDITIYPSANSKFEIICDNESFVFDSLEVEDILEETANELNCKIHL